MFCKFVGSLNKEFKTDIPPANWNLKTLPWREHFFSQCT